MAGSLKQGDKREPAFVLEKIKPLINAAGMRSMSAGVILGLTSLFHCLCGAVISTAISFPVTVVVIYGLDQFTYQLFGKLQPVRSMDYQICLVVSSGP